MTGHDRLLIVDDEAAIRLQFRAIAEQLGYEVAEAEDGYQFTRLYAQFKPNLALLDLTMPDGDGIELLRGLAADSYRHGVILASGPRRNRWGALWA